MTRDRDTAPDRDEKDQDIRPGQNPGDNRGIAPRDRDRENPSIEPPQRRPEVKEPPKKIASSTF